MHVSSDTWEPKHSGPSLEEDKVMGPSGQCYKGRGSSKRAQSSTVRRAISPKYRREGQGRPYPHQPSWFLALRWEVEFPAASLRSRTQRPSQVQIGPVDTKPPPKEKLQPPQNSLHLLFPAPPPVSVGTMHSCVYPGQFQLRSCQRQSANSPQRCLPSAASRQPASQAVHTSCPAWHQAASWPPPGAGSVPRCHPLVSSRASLQPPFLQPLGTPRSGGNGGFQGSGTPQE